MSDFVKMESSLFKAIMQSLLEGKRHARDLENFVDAILPIVEDEIKKGELEEVKKNAATAAHILQSLYNGNVRSAFEP